MGASLMLINRDGSKGKQLSVSLRPSLLAPIPEDALLSFKCSAYHGVPEAAALFTIGGATAEIHRYFAGSTDWVYSVTIESSNAADFELALNEVYRRLGKPFEDVTPQFKISPDNQSFVRGIRNDFRKIRALLKNSDAPSFAAVLRQVFR